MASENVLALLNLASGLRSPGETYLEIGTWKGLSLVAASLGQPGPIVAVDDFSMPGSKLRELTDFLARVGLTDVEVRVGLAADILRDGALQDHRVGVCYYDADHSPHAIGEALSLARRYFAEPALIILDDADWPHVAEAANAWVEACTGAETIFDIPGTGRGGHGWWHGVRVIAVRQPGG